MLVNRQFYIDSDGDVIFCDEDTWQMDREDEKLFQDFQQLIESMKILMQNCMWFF